MVFAAAQSVRFPGFIRLHCFNGPEVFMPDKEELYDEAIDRYAEQKYEEAIAIYNRALQIDPTYADAVHGLVMCYQAKGDLDSAIELTKRYIEQEPEDILAFTNLSMFYQKKGMIKEAEAAGAEARRLDWKRQLKESKRPN